jgi:pimeloyl-ACP methyl ester carboxylesterase
LRRPNASWLIPKCSSLPKRSGSSSFVTTPSLNWYRANLAPRMPGLPPNLRPVEAPTLGIWSTNDHFLDGERMKMSGRLVKGAWRYEQIEDASHWIPLDAPDRLNHLLIEWLG